MAKKKKNLSDVFAKKRNDRMEAKKTITPFEIYATKDKKQVLGRKLKNDKGLPGISRMKAIDKRKKTLLLEYKVKDKNNMFLDTRIGEKNSGMTEEDKAMARLAAEKIKVSKKNIYNLNDEEVLTHRGQALVDIEKYEDPRSDEDSDDDRSGNLDKKFVEKAHFGGGDDLLKQSSDVARKNVIENLIAESKKRKAERQMTKEKTLQQTEKLDSDFKNLMSVLASSKISKNDVQEKSTIDDYDKVMRQMKFEVKGHPTDKLKSEEVIAKEEKIKLEKLESERLSRMIGFSDDFKAKHRSADDLDDFLIEVIEDKSDEEEEEDKEEIEQNDKKTDNESEDDDKNNGENSDQDNSHESENNLSDTKKSENESDDDEKSEQDDSESEDNLSDLKFSESDSEEESEENSIPDDLEDNLSNLKATVEKIINCNNFKLKYNNYTPEKREKMLNLFKLLLKYLDKCASVNNQKELKQFFQNFDKINPHLYDLRDANVFETKTYLHDVLKEKHELFESKIKYYPKLNTLILFKLVSNLYTTSDFRHPIVTPCLVFMSQILLRCKIREKIDITKGLFLCTLILEYTVLNKRWSPEAINFLRGIIYVSLPKPFLKSLKVIPPFKQVGDSSNILVLEENHKKSDIESLSNGKMLVKDFVGKDLDDDFKIRTFFTAINLLCEFFEQCKELDAAYTIFEPIFTLLTNSSVKRYPKTVRKKVKFLINEIEKLKEKKLEHLQFDKKKPKALRLIEPKIEKVYDSKKRANMTEAQQERQKLMAKLKHERKSAMREIRRDNTFLAKVKLKQQISADEERKRKVKEIYGDAATQQHDLKQIKRQKLK